MHLFWHKYIHLAVTPWLFSDKHPLTSLVVVVWERRLGEVFFLPLNCQKYKACQTYSFMFPPDEVSCLS